MNRERTLIPYPPEAAMLMFWYGVLLIGLLAVITRATLGSSMHHRVALSIVSAFVIINLFYATEMPGIYFGLIGILVHLKVFPLLVIAGIYLTGFYKTSRDHPRVQWWWQRVAVVSALGLVYGLLTAAYDSCKSHQGCATHLPNAKEYDFAIKQAGGMLAAPRKPVYISEYGMTVVEATPDGQMVGFGFSEAANLSFIPEDWKRGCFALQANRNDYRLCENHPSPPTISANIFTLQSLDGKPRKIIVTASKVEKPVHKREVAEVRPEIPARDADPPQVAEQQGMSFRMADRLADSLARYGQGLPIMPRHAAPSPPSAPVPKVSIFPGGEVSIMLWKNQNGCYGNTSYFSVRIDDGGGKIVWTADRGTLETVNDNTRLVVHESGNYVLKAMLEGTSTSDSVIIHAWGCT